MKVFVASVTAFRRFGFPAALLWLGLLFPTLLAAQTPIGETTQQSPQIRALADSKVALQNGAMTSSVAIAVPEFHGITPQLTLAYSSSAGNGFVGVGWNLQGFSVIERAAPRRGSPRYAQAATNDIFLLDGEELVPSYALGGNYATRRQSFLRISGSGSPGANWIVTQRDGTVMTFSPIFTAENVPFRWGLTRVVDSHGNDVRYAWQCESASLSSPIGNVTLDCYPASVTYGTTVVTIARETRPDPETFATGHRLGRTNYRLKTISVDVGGARLRSYKIAYTTSARTGRSLLSSIQQLGKDNVTALPAITATWSDTARGLETAVTVSDHYGLTLRIWQCSDMETDDFNGDGRMDFLLVDRCSVYDPRAYLLLANSTGTFNNAVDITNQSGMTAQTWLYSTVKVTGDFDGDGTADLLIRHTVGSILKMYRLLGSTSTTNTFGYAVDITASYGLTATNWMYSDIQMADFNGDGKADLLLRGLYGDYFAYLLTASSNGDFNTYVNVANLYGMTGEKWNNALTFGDFNGDGKTDMILRDTSPYTAYLLQASATGGFDTVVDITSKYTMNGQRWLQANLITGDFNGDRRTDLLVAPGYLKTDPYVILYAQGSDGATPQSYLAFENPIVVTTLWGMTYERWQNANILAGDFNGDGRSDILVQSPLSNTSVQDPTLMLYSNGPGFQTAVDITGSYGMDATSWAYSDYRIGDYDGDGDDDLFRHAYAGSGVYASMPQQMLKGNGATGNLLTTLANGYGGTTTVSYKPSTYWANSNNPPRTQTVSALTTSDGRGWSSTTNFSYSGGSWDPLERRHLGFRYIKATDPTGAYQESYFYQGEKFQSGELEDFYQRNSTGGVMTRSHRTLTASASMPWVSTLTKQDDYECNGDSTCKQAQKTFVYDAYGNVTSTTDQGDTALAGDERTTVQSYNANTSAFLVSAPAVVSTYQGTSSAGTLLRQTRNYYDNGVLSAPPVKGDATRTENWLNTTSAYVATTSTYDAFGNKTSETDPLLHTTSVGWDAAGLFPLSTTNALSQVERSTWDSGCGVPLATTDVNNQVTTSTYDTLCRRTKTLRPDGGSTEWVYVNYGNPSWQYNGEIVNNGTAGTRWRVSVFDGLGREWESYNNIEETVETYYDNRGLVSKVSAPYLGAEARKYTTYGYDALRRLITTTLPDASTRRMLYGDWTTTTCDELSKPRTRYRDAYGQVRQVREYLGVGCAVAPACMVGTTCFDTRIDYDLLGQRVATTDAGGNISTSTYDSLGRRTAMTDPDMGRWTYTYDNAGRLLSQTDAKAAQIQFVYDVINRPTQKKTSGGSILATYFYDEAGHGAGIGRRTRMVDPSGSSSVIYDVMGHVTSEQKKIGTVTHNVARAYDQEGRVKSVTYPDGEVLPYTYDAVGRLATAGSYVTAATYDARGNQKTRTLGNGTVETLAYDPNRFWLASATVAKGTTTLSRVSLGHNLRGEVSSRGSADATAQDNWTYGYDDLRRLTAATNTGNSAWSQTFGYDALGRMTAQTGIGNYVYPTSGTAPRHAPASVNGQVHNYDRNGNLLSGSGNSLTYDIENRPLSANGQVLVYDGDGTRVKQGNTAYVSNLYEVDTATSVATNYIFFNNSMVARKSSGAVHYYHGDQLGSVSTMTDSTGSVVLRKTYSPFGKVLKTAGTLVDAFGLAGQRLDPSGLYHMGAREMAPGLGLFITPDPSNAPDPERPQTLNRYAYVENSPTNLFDPTGYAAESSWQEWFRKAGDAIEPYSQSVGGLLSRGELGTAESNYQGFGLALAEPGVDLYNSVNALPIRIGLVEPLPPVRYENNQLVGATAGTLLPLVFSGGESAEFRVSATRSAPEGVIYLRTDRTRAVLPYGGQAKSEARFFKRQQEHARDYPNSDFDYSLVGRANPGTELDVAEHNFIQKLTNGVAARFSPLVSNKKDPVGAKRRAALGLPEPSGKP